MPTVIYAYSTDWMNELACSTARQATEGENAREKDPPI
ncbi:hypothetical protein MYCODSM44623_05549 (plasmid) [Mycobacterium intracellulare subsp. chimaera]|uniref:Uncharacterized protein n=1 Tax=Mycobacterium intracellulare subsp. chimaera TaxID=222805 RepID=A0A7U5MR72_MYCIT|nr:hypothetical protein MYCODSM44623_05549 [Mycobacterium intracellulare subsp. chimaera]ASL18184.1 hypothetical protein MYCOZU2_05839 [Mycobacterium intracellulare subsp. chimaera]